MLDQLEANHRSENVFLNRRRNLPPSQYTFLPANPVRPNPTAAAVIVPNPICLGLAFGMFHRDASVGWILKECSLGDAEAKDRVVKPGCLERRYAEVIK